MHLTILYNIYTLLYNTLLYYTIVYYAILYLYTHTIHTRLYFYAYYDYTIVSTHGNSTYNIGYGNGSAEARTQGTDHYRPLD